MQFLKNLVGELEHIKIQKFEPSDCTAINIYAMDESRFGLLTIQRRCLTARGIKPLVPYQHQFKNFYLFGAYSPINGDHYTRELPYCNTDCFQYYLDGFAAQKPEEFKILILDNGGFSQGGPVGDSQKHSAAVPAALQSGAESGREDVALYQRPAGK